MEKLLKLLEINKYYDDASEELLSYYHDSGSFSNVYSVGDVVVKVFFDFDGLLYLEDYMSDNVQEKLKEMILSTNYSKKNDYTIKDYIQFLFDEMTNEPKKLNELSSIGCYPKVKSFNKDYLCMSKVEGLPLFQLNEEKLSNIPMECWLNLIDNLYKAVMIGYRPVDLSENNIFWSEKDKCFYLIDVGLYIKDNPINLHVPLFLKKDKYKEVFAKLNEVYCFDMDYEELNFN